MKSFCIKTNNTNIINYLLKRFSDSNIENIYYRNNEFRLYKNVIIHYTGSDLSLFFNQLSDIITDCIIKFYEEKILSHIINFNYFYFDSYEKDEIKKDCLNILKLENISNYANKRETILVSVFEYIMEHNSMILSGFVNFRISDYTKSLDYIVDVSVNKFILEKEYREFIDLLKLYIYSKKPNKELIHLIYMGEDSILLDENKNIISVSKNVFNAKYLSDITFSSNDYILNTLLDLLPEKINVHLINIEDDFIKTLKSIFEKRLYICTDCDICKTYKLISKELSSINQSKGKNLHF
ncbi:MAG TPA: putative sporulation protein YtxC [Clostridiaceae bacterium]|nr:putative sporulation protein YtxC [Clostridiaceae bacterium]